MQPPEVSWNAFYNCCYFSFSVGHFLTGLLSQSNESNQVSSKLQQLLHLYHELSQFSDVGCIHYTGAGIEIPSKATKKKEKKEKKPEMHEEFLLSSPGQLQQ